MKSGEVPQPDVADLLGWLLRAQKQTTLVEAFSEDYEQVKRSTGKVYEASVDAYQTVGPGQQLAFRVDLDMCTGCKACVTACHSLNGLAPHETWRDVGALMGLTPESDVQQTVTTACHHCHEPGCLEGCPVQAYEKDERTGVVKHLDDQCIGCKYCILKCPYDVPKYNESIGIVRKCDMCAERLTEGEAPACVQGCPNEAISIQIVSTELNPSASSLLPGDTNAIPSSDYTKPSTQYITERKWPKLQPADRHRVKLSEAHEPLAVMLVMTQLSVGILVLGLMHIRLGYGGAASSLLIASLSGGLGMGAATLHLGRPMYAFRAFLGWRTSWLSREIILFGGYIPLVLSAYGALHILEFNVAWQGLYVASCLVGIVALGCSVMIYVDTRRPVWALSRTLFLFGSSAVGLGAMGQAIILYSTSNSTAAPYFLLISNLVLTVKVLYDLKVIRMASIFSSQNTGALDICVESLLRTSRLLKGPARHQVRCRFAFATVGLSLSITAVLLGTIEGILTIGLLVVAGVAWFVADLLERHLYFTTESSFKMPGC